MDTYATVLRTVDVCYTTPLFDFNLLLDNCRIFELNEKYIENKIDKLDEIGNGGVVFQLTLARITELAVICAGNYADNFEFSAVGDLLVNPRLIHIHIKGIKEPVQKNRHAALTQQFESETDTPSETIQWISQNTQLEIIKQPLLPYLYDRLKNSGTIASNYLDSICRRMEKIAKVIGFLSACRFSDARMVYNQRQFSSKTEWDFINSNLCRFNTEIFFDLGNDIYRLIEKEQECRKLVL